MVANVPLVDEGPVGPLPLPPPQPIAVAMLAIAMQGRGVDAVLAVASFTIPSMKTGTSFNSLCFMYPSRINMIS